MVVVVVVVVVAAVVVVVVVVVSYSRVQIFYFPNQIISSTNVHRS